MAKESKIERYLCNKPQISFRIRAFKNGNVKVKSDSRQKGCDRMTTPRKQQIVQRAKEIWFNEQFKNGIMNPNVPEECELKECGAWSQAVSELMANESRKYVEYQDYAKYMEFMEKIENLEPSKDFFDVETALRSGFAIFGNSGSGKTNLCKLIVDQLNKHGITTFILDSSKQWFDVGFNVVSVEREKGYYQWKGNTIFDLSNLAIWDKVTFTDKLCEHLLERDRSQWEIVIFEECQLFIPNNALRDLKRYGNILKLVSIGRNYHLRYGLVSQFPSYVDKFFVRNTMLRYYGWIHEPNDMRYVRQLLSKEYAEMLKTLKVGEFVYQNGSQIRKIQVPLFQKLVPSSGKQAKSGFNIEYQYAEVRA